MPKRKKKALTLYEKVRRIRASGIGDAMGLDGRRSLRESAGPVEDRIQKILGIFADGDPKTGQMLFFVMYDIEHDRIRHYISKYLERKGLIRIQKSIFLGSAERKVFKGIHNDLKTVQEMYDNEDSIILVPVSTDELRSMKVIGQNIDLDLVLANKNTLFI